MPRSRYRFLGNDAPCFMTMTVNHWLPIFTRPETVEIVLSSWRYLQANEDFRLHGYAVLESHLHLLGGSAQIGQDIQRFKSYTARRIIDQLVAARTQRLLDLLARFKRLHKSHTITHKSGDFGTSGAYRPYCGLLPRTLATVYQALAAADGIGRQRCG
jgi:putative transposase